MTPNEARKVRLKFGKPRSRPAEVLRMEQQLIEKLQRSANASMDTCEIDLAAIGELDETELAAALMPAKARSAKR